MQSKKTKVIILVIALLLLGGYIAFVLIDSKTNMDVDNQALSQTENKEPSNNQEEAAKPDEELVQEIPSNLYTHQGALEDVINNEVVSKRRGIVTSADTTGTARYGYIDGTYNLLVEFTDLPTPNNDDFYEGWIVRQSPFAFISTGELKYEQDKWINEFSSDIDYSDYDFYVLTIEPNDGDPAPAGHVLEGYMREEL